MHFTQYREPSKSMQNATIEKITPDVLRNAMQNATIEKFPTEALYCDET